jgi:hypothetical protein
MRRLMILAVCGLLAASLQVAAQHGGGHGGGGHAGFSGGGGFGGHSSAGSHAFSGARSGSGYGARSMSRGSSYRSPLGSRGLYSRNLNRSGVGARIGSYGYSTRYGLRNNCHTYGCGLGYGYPYVGGGVDPYWWWGSDSGNGNNQDYYDQMGLANEMNQESLDQQGMRQQQANQDSYARSSPPQRHQAERTEAAPPTVLIFRDQHTEQIQNYAIIGQTLWNFAPQHTEKIPLSDIDLPATTKVNEDRGVGFSVPGANEGQ